MIKFASDENLGQVVKTAETKAWCFGFDPIESIDDLRFAAGGNKFSQLCAFKFVSANHTTYTPRFTIAFVAKMRSKFYHQAQTNPSQWYIFKQVNANQVDVLDKNACFVNYGFDIDKFFDSDMFKLMVPRFKQMIDKGLQKAEALKAKTPEIRDQKQIQQYINTISEASKLIGGHAVNDKYYKLMIHEAEDPELDEKIEQELHRQGVYVDMNDAEDAKEVDND